MKKATFLLGLSALTLASCSQEEVIQVNPNSVNDGSISFQARIGKASRADELTTENLMEFSVFAYKGDVNELGENDHMTEWFDGAVAFKRNPVPGDEDLNTFRSEKKYYFPTDGTPLTFMAYSPSTVAVEPTDQGELKFNNFTVNDNIEDQVDLLVDCTPAYAVDIDPLDPESAGIYFGFKHMLAKVYVSAAWNNNEDYTYEVAGIKLGNIAKSGDGIFNKFDKSAYMDEDGEFTGEVPYAEWTPSKTLGNLVYIFDEPVAIGENSTPLMSGGLNEFGTVDKKGAFLVIPQEVAHSTVSHEDGTVEGGSAEESVTKLEFKEGMAYVALLLRITYTKTGETIYPYAQGTDNVSETINGVKYAWAAFPIASTWTAGFFTDYVVDLSNGAGFIPGEAEGYNIQLDAEDPENTWFVDLKYRPVLGYDIHFMEWVEEWSQGNENTLGHDHDSVSHTYEAVVNSGTVEDPFGE